MIVITLNVFKLRNSMALYDCNHFECILKLRNSMALYDCNQNLRKISGFY